MSASQTGIIFGAYSFGQLLLSLPAALLVPRLGAKTCLVAGQMVVGIGSLAFACIVLLPAGTVFFASAVSIRLMQAAGASLSIVADMSILLGHYKERSTSLFVSFDDFYFNF